MAYRLLTEFEKLFRGRIYRHRASTQGDRVAVQLYEDLVTLDRSAKLNQRVHAHERVLNTQNTRHGIKARRGDATFGEIIPNEPAVALPGHVVSRGPIATVEIGGEVKILLKAMIKQIDRVVSDLRGQVDQFRRGGGSGSPICVGIVGVNWADHCVGYEGERPFPTTGRGSYRHPVQEAAEAVSRLEREAKSAFDEFLILPFRATNEPPFAFDWVDARGTERDYGAALVRIGREYDKRF